MLSLHTLLAISSEYRIYVGIRPLYTTLPEESVCQLCTATDIRTLLFINNRTVSIPVSVITLAITWAYRCEYGVQLSLQYNLPRIRLWYLMVSNTHHTIFVHHQAWRVVRPAVQITSCTYIQERINHVVLACIYIYRTQRELTTGCLACRTIWATSHGVYDLVTRRSIVLVTQPSCLPLFATRGIKALDVSRAFSINFMSVSHMSGQMTM